MSSGIQIEPRHWAIVAALLRRHVPSSEVWVFGSRALGQARPYSDLDIVIRAHQELPFSTIAALKDELEHSDLPYKVDVLDWAILSPEFRKVVDRSKVKFDFASVA